MSKIKYLVTSFVGAFLATVFLIMFWTFGPGMGKYGAYNPNTDSFWCTTDWSCRHEVGHRMDWYLGNPSQGNDYKMAVRLYIVMQLKTDNPSKLSIWLLSQDQTSLELYATLYEHVAGNVGSLPATLQPYYSQDEKYQRLYDCLVQSHVQVCGRALRLAVGRNIQASAITPHLVLPSR